MCVIVISFAHMCFCYVSFLSALLVFVCVFCTDCRFLERNPGRQWSTMRTSTYAFMCLFVHFLAPLQMLLLCPHLRTITRP